jgi:hypothetical protein
VPHTQCGISDLHLGLRLRNSPFLDIDMYLCEARHLDDHILLSSSILQFASSKWYSFSITLGRTAACGAMPSTLNRSSVGGPVSLTAGSEPAMRCRPFSLRNVSDYQNGVLTKVTTHETSIEFEYTSFLRVSRCVHRKDGGAHELTESDKRLPMTLPHSFSVSAEII